MLVSSMPFDTASQLFTNAVQALAPAPRDSLPSIASTIGAASSANEAIALLEPIAASGDRFVSRAAANAVERAREGVAALQTNIGFLDGGFDLPVNEAALVANVAAAVKSFTAAELALWIEGA